MKKILLTGIISLGLFGAKAQVPDNGVLSQNVIITDIDGNTHDFYSILDQGTPIILDLFAEWCGPCWNYHDPGSSHPNAGALKDLHSTYGPLGTNELMVFGVDSHSGGTEAELQGGQGTNGWDWVTGTPYPLAVQTIGGIFNQSYYPTIVMICPDRSVTEIGQQSMGYIYNQIGGCGAASTTTNDARLIDFTGTTESCGAVDATVAIQNFGSATLTTATVKAYIGGSEVASSTWTGSLDQYEVEEFDVTGITITQNETITFEIDNSDDDNNNNDISQAISYVNDEYVGELTVEIVLDNYPEETSWRFKNETGGVVAAGGPYSGQNDGATVTETVNLPSTGCYTFVILDSYGDGLSLGNPDGTYTVTDGNGDVLASGGGSDEWEEEITTFKMGSLASTDVASANEFKFSVYPNPFNESATVSINADNKNVNMTLTSVLGQNVWNKSMGVVNGQKDVKIDAANLESGIYFLTVEVEGKVQTKRITVNK